MLNKRGDIAITIVIMIVLVAIAAILFGYIGFDSNIKDKIKGVKEPIRQAIFIQQYLTAQSQIIGEESIKKGGDIKSNFIQIAMEKDIGIEDTGNYFGKIRNGEFEFFVNEAERGTYLLKVENLFIHTSAGTNELVRTYTIAIEFDNNGNLRKVYKDW